MCLWRFKLKTIIAREVEQLYRRALEDNWSAQEFMNEREKILNFYGKTGKY